MATYKTYAPSTDIAIGFKTNPVTTGILNDGAKGLKFEYYSLSNPSVLTEIPSTGPNPAKEQNGTYITPKFQIATEGDYVVVCSYTTDKGAATPVYTKMSESNIMVGTAGSGAAGLAFGAVI